MNKEVVLTLELTQDEIDALNFVFDQALFETGDYEGYDKEIKVATKLWERIEQ